MLNIQEFADNPLPDVECRPIAKSCAKYSIRNSCENRFSARQVARNGKRWHNDRNYDFVSRSETVGMMVGMGYKHREIAQIFGVTEGTIRQDLKKYPERRHLESIWVTPGIP